MWPALPNAVCERWRVDGVIKTKTRRHPLAVMAALLKEWLVEDLKIKSSCAQLEKVQPTCATSALCSCHYKGCATDFRVTTPCSCRTWQVDIFLAKFCTKANCSLTFISLRTAEPQLQSSTITGVYRYHAGCLQTTVASPRFGCGLSYACRDT